LQTKGYIPLPIATVSDLQSELSRLSGRKILLYLTDNRRRMVSARRHGDVLEVRLQRAFLDAPPGVIGELGDILAGRECDRAALRRFIDGALPADAPPAARRPPNATARDSSHHDLSGYASRLNETYLGGRSRAGVVWGRRDRRKSRSSIRFACYDPARNLIIMNRKLDRPDIPAYFVEFVLFHEMLHEVLGMDEGPDGRRSIHGKLFKLMESTYPDYEKALRFEKELCKRLGSL
jgi:hypothetical protein